MAQPLNTQKNGAQGTSVLITLFAWFIQSLPKVGAIALLNVLNINHDKNTDVYDKLVKVLYREYLTKKDKPNAFRGHLNRPFKTTDIDFDISHALNSLPFVEVIRRPMVRVSGYVTGRSKQTETETRREKNGAELQDGKRHFCGNCGWLRHLGFNAEGVRICCGSPAQLLTREVAVSDRFEPSIRIPWIIGGSFVNWLANTKTLGGDPVKAVSRIVNSALYWNHDDLMLSTNRRHHSHGFDKTGRDAQKRIKTLLCRIPIMNDFGELVPMWVNLPAIKGDIFHPVARIYHELCDAELKRIRDYNIMLNQHTRLISVLNNNTKTLKVSGLVDAPTAVQNHLKRYPQAKNINLNSVARVEERRQKKIEI
tara:strand:+ start:138 stop:1238 length:1101 start_codon:yes stop_codon:yes gene_type:complete